MLNYRLEPLGLVEGFTAEVGASGSFCPNHLTLPVDVSFYSVSDDNAPSPYMVRSRWSIRNSVSFLPRLRVTIRVLLCASPRCACWWHGGCVFSQGVINLESLGKRGYRVPPSGTIQVVRNLFTLLFTDRNVQHMCSMVNRAENKEQSALSRKRRGRPLVVVEENSSYVVLRGGQCLYLLFILLWQAFCFIYLNCIM